MKKSLLALAALSAVASLPAAAAVTLSGTVDTNVQYIDNGTAGSVTSVSSGGNAATQFTFAGNEDLGGGLKASFHLEKGFASDTGAAADPTSFFNRRSTLSLAGGFGEMRLGRDASPTYVANTAFDPFGGVGIAQVSTLIPAPASTGVFASNQVQWFSPEISGFKANFSLAPSEGVVGGKYTGGRLAYASGKLGAQFAYGETELGALGTFKQTTGGASYDLGSVKVQGSVTEGKLGSNKATTVLVGAVMPMGAGELRASYVHADYHVSNGKSSQFALGYVHNLSKRTALYGTVAYMTNDDALAGGLLGTPTAFGDSSKGVEMGIRHSF